MKFIFIILFTFYSFNSWAYTKKELNDIRYLVMKDLSYGNSFFFPNSTIGTRVYWAPLGKMQTAYFKGSRAQYNFYSKKQCLNWRNWGGGYSNKDPEIYFFAQSKKTKKLYFLLKRIKKNKFGSFEIDKKKKLSDYIEVVQIGSDVKISPRTEITSYSGGRKYYEPTLNYITPNKLEIILPFDYFNSDTQLKFSFWDSPYLKKIDYFYERSDDKKPLFFNICRASISEIDKILLTVIDEKINPKKYECLLLNPNDNDRGKYSRKLGFKDKYGNFTPYKLPPTSKSSATRMNEKTCKEQGFKITTDKYEASYIGR
jgi:hypothetical protein